MVGTLGSCDRTEWNVINELRRAASRHLQASPVHDLYVNLWFILENLCYKMVPFLYKFLSVHVGSGGDMEILDFRRRTPLHRLVHKSYRFELIEVCNHLLFCRDFTIRRFNYNLLAVVMWSWGLFERIGQDWFYAAHACNQTNSFRVSTLRHRLANKEAQSKSNQHYLILNPIS